MLTCREVTELVTDYVEGRLRLRDRLAMAMHVAMCPRCRRYLRQVRAVVAALPAVPVPPAPDDVVAVLSGHFAAAPPKKRPMDAGLLSLFGGSGGFVVALTILVAAMAHALVTGTSEGGDGVPPWAPCLAGEVGAGALALAVGAHLLGPHAGAGGWAAVAAIGAGAASFVLALVCPVEPTTAHLLTAHVGGVAMVTVVAATLRAWLVTPTPR
ncbi:MAG: zf-HC2 domain-containing protein [Deltaproteobacteria bacterium]|nr:zf-HC2 domain-containing protein [Deltaproteobacteria bacterium]